MDNNILVFKSQHLIAAAAKYLFINLLPLE